MDDFAKSTVFRNLDLLTSGEYSDFTIQCEKKIFKVHKAVICPQSAFFRKLCEGEFKEAKEAKAKLDHEDPALLARVILFPYSGEYLISTNHASSKLGLPERRLKLTYLANTLGLSTKLDHSEYVRYKTATDLTIDAGLYVRGEQYLIPQLKEKAHEIFSNSLLFKCRYGKNAPMPPPTAAATDFGRRLSFSGRNQPSLLDDDQMPPPSRPDWAKDFITAVTILYDNLPGEDRMLINSAIRAARKHTFLLQSKRLFLELCDRHPEFAWAVVEADASATHGSAAAEAEEPGEAAAFPFGAVRHSTPFTRPAEPLLDRRSSGRGGQPGFNNSAGSPTSSEGRVRGRGAAGAARRGRGGRPST